MRAFLLFFLLMLSANSLFAAPLKLNYSLFFGYMKTLYKLQYDQVTTAFYLRDKNSGAACLIKQAEMVVDNKREAIAFTENGRLLPFFSDQHRKDGAMIEVELLPGQASYQCDLQVTLMAKESQLSNLSWSQLALISEQLQGVLKKNAGMIGKYFLPTFNGVRVQLTHPLSEAQLRQLDDQIKLAQNGDLLIANSAIKRLQSDAFPELNIARITPWLVK